MEGVSGDRAWRMTNRDLKATRVKSYMVIM